LTQDAFLRLLDEQDRPWEVGGFLTHMSIVMRDSWKERLRRRRRYPYEPEKRLRVARLGRASVAG
jgi:hypothetical protein